MKRALSLADALGIGLNGIVGSGVYLLVAPLARVAGGSSVAGVLVCGALCVLIALSFAELSSMYDESGGPYVYARDAFGRLAGFAVGWLGMATGVLGLAAVAVGFAAALARFVPAAATARVPIAVLLIAALGAINARGVKAGGRTSTWLSVAKLLPLVAVALAGLRFAPRAHLTLHPRAVASAAFLSIFMMSGFEYAAVPAGEVQNARRNVPLAILGSVSGAALLYALLQLAALSTLPDLASTEQPLPDVAARVLGPMGAPLLGAAALLSMLGFCASVALVAPRYFVALAADGHLPAALTRLSPRGTPVAAIGASTAFAAGLALLLGYASLVDVANVVILSGYALTCLAALLLRFKLPDRPRRLRLPCGPLLPLLAFGAACALLASAHTGLREWRFSLGLLALGFLVRALSGLPRRRPGKQP